LLPKNRVVQLGHQAKSIEHLLNPKQVSNDSKHNIEHVIICNGLSFGLISAAKPRSLSISISPTPVAGTTLPAAGLLSFLSLEKTTVQAFPNGGYNFQQWVLDGKVVGTSPTITITAGDTDHQLIAVFFIDSISLFEFAGALPVSPPPIPPPIILKNLPYGYYNTPYTQEAAQIDGVTRAENLRIRNS
jgi:hypothetical protein